MYIKIDNDTVVTENGVELRRTDPPSEWWLEYEAWIAAGNIPPDKFPSQKWNTLTDNARMRLRGLQPTQ